MLKQTILILNWRLPSDPKSGGAERVTLAHARAWEKAGYEVIWLSGSSTGFYQSIKKDGIRLLGVGPVAFFFCFAWIYRLLFIRTRVDCIVDEVHGFPAWSPLWAPKTPKIVLIHELAKEIWDQMYPFPVNWIGQLIESKVFPRLYRHIPLWVDSTSMVAELTAIGFESNQISVIPCALEKRQDRLPVRKSEKCTLAVVSRLVPMKGVTYAIETFAQIAEQGNECELWILGDGDPAYIQQLHKLVAGRKLTGSVKFFGKVSEKRKFELLSQAHFLLHTSIREGFGLTILEAESVSTPTAVFAVTGLTDLVDDGVNGIKVDFPRTTELAKKIIRLKNDPKAYTTLCKRAREHEKRYRWEEFTARSLIIIRELTSSKE